MTTQEPRGAAKPLRLDARLGAPGVVFVGVGIIWTARPSDLEMNTRLAEKLHRSFPAWDISERSVMLQDRRNLYRIHLFDGSAQFLIETVKGYERALEDVPALLEGLPEAVREDPLHGRIETQYLWPSESSFEDRVKAVAPRLLNTGFPRSAPGELEDFSYLADHIIGEYSFQINVGVVRRDEVSRRVRATIVRPPEVSTFCNIAQTWHGIETLKDCTEALNRTVALGRDIMRELE
jgi:hypothetical protein